MAEKTTIHSLPPELTAAVFSHLKALSSLYWPQVQPGKPVQWPAHYIEQLLQKKKTEATEAEINEEIPQHVAIVFILSSVCKLWKEIASVVFEEFERFLPKNTHDVFFHDSLRAPLRAPLYAMHIIGNSLDGKKSILDFSNDVVKHGKTLRFVHISSHIFFYMALPKNHEDWPAASRDSWKAANCNVAQWVLNTCPNLVHLEISLAVFSALNWWALGDFPAKNSLDTLHHANLETIGVMTPLRVDSAEHALVEDEREDNSFTVDDKHYIDPDFFSSFDTSGLPKLKSVIILQQKYGLQSEESDRKMWAETLKEKGLAVGMSCVNGRISARRVIWLNGTETDKEIDDVSWDLDLDDDED